MHRSHCPCKRSGTVAVALARVCTGVHTRAHLPARSFLSCPASLVLLCRPSQAETGLTGKSRLSPLLWGLPPPPTDGSPTRTALSTPLPFQGGSTRPYLSPAACCAAVFSAGLIWPASPKTPSLHASYGRSRRVGVHPVNASAAPPPRGGRSPQARPRRRAIRPGPAQQRRRGVPILA